jgi:hypothetical protein
MQGVSTRTGDYTPRVNSKTSTTVSAADVAANSTSADSTGSQTNSAVAQDSSTTEFALRVMYVPDGARLEFDPNSTVSAQGTGVSPGLPLGLPSNCTLTSPDQVRCLLPEIKWPWQTGASVPTLGLAAPAPTADADNSALPPEQCMFLRTSEAESGGAALQHTASAGYTLPSSATAAGTTDSATEGLPHRAYTQTSSFLDASFLYGTSEAWSGAVREFAGGRLLLSPDSNEVLAPNLGRLPVDNYLGWDSEATTGTATVRGPYQPMPSAAPLPGRADAPSNKAGRRLQSLHAHGQAGSGGGHSAVSSTRQGAARTLQGGDPPASSINLASSTPQQGSAARRSFRKGFLQPLVGNRKSTQFPPVLALHTVFARYHNRVAAWLQSTNPHWDDELLFQRARRYVRAVWGRIVVSEYLPSLGVVLPRYAGYRIAETPSLSDAFVATLRAIGHGSMPAALWRLPPLKPVITAAQTQRSSGDTTMCSLELARRWNASVAGVAAAQANVSMTHALLGVRVCELFMPLHGQQPCGGTDVLPAPGPDNAVWRAGAFYSLLGEDVDAILRGAIFVPQKELRLGASSDMRRFMFATAGRGFGTAASTSVAKGSVLLPSGAGTSASSFGSGSGTGNASYPSASLQAGGGGPAFTTVRVPGASHLLRADMSALDMASWRDDGVGSFNMVRRAYSMHPAAGYSSLSQDATLQGRVRAVYGGDVDDVEYVIGGLLETTSSSSPLGATFVAVLLSHFEKGKWMLDSAPAWVRSECNLR